MFIKWGRSEKVYSFTRHRTNICVGDDAKGERIKMLMSFIADYEFSNS